MGETCNSRYKLTWMPDGRRKSKAKQTNDDHQLSQRPGAVRQPGSERLGQVARRQVSRSWAFRQALQANGL
jgi:hypothetical protein